MPYKYDVFISYRRYGLWPQWVKEHFLPIFQHWLGEELGKNVRICWDGNLETGNDWPPDLGDKLAASRTLVPLLSRQYFNSAWCKTELALMCARESRCGLIGGQLHKRLIVPAIIHDGEYLPQYVRVIQAAKLQDCANVLVAPESPTLEDLSNRIRSWVPDVVKAIRRAPKHDPHWTELSIDQFKRLFEVPKAKQGFLPRFG
jgi:hypothetical protein